MDIILDHKLIQPDVPAQSYNRNTRTRSCETYSKLTVKTPEQREVTFFVLVSVSLTSDLVLVLLLPTLNK